MSDPTAPSLPEAAPKSRTELRTPARPAALRVLQWRGSDEEFLEQVKLDAQRGAALLHDRFAADVNGLVWRLLGADADHDDLVQQVFVQLIIGVRRVRDSAKLRSWVQSVTVNAVYSELRKRAVRRLFWQTEKPETSHTISESIESRDLLLRVHQALEQMPVAERLVFSLRYVEECPLKEVAELCNCSLATAKRRLQRANKRFEALAQRYPELSERFARREQGGGGAA